MATCSSVLAWRIPGTGEPGGLLSMGSHRVRHDWSDLAEAYAFHLPDIKLNNRVYTFLTHIPLCPFSPYWWWLLGHWFSLELPRSFKNPAVQFHSQRWFDQYECTLDLGKFQRSLGILCSQGWEPLLIDPCYLHWASLVAQVVKNPSAIQETWVWSLGWEDPLKKGKATHSSILAWRIPWAI